MAVQELPMQTVRARGGRKPIAFLHSFFRSPTDAAITIACLALLWLVVWPFVKWVTIDAAWIGQGGGACANIEGACWVFVRERMGTFVFGTYPSAERWRVMLVFAGAIIGVAALLLPRVPGKPKIALVMLTAFPAAAAILLAGGVFGLEPVPTRNWGGLTLTLVVAIWGIVTTIPIGMALALGRRSNMFLVRTACAIYVEFWRALPLLGVLFMAATMFPLFVPPGIEFDKLMRALIAFTLFNAAYMAEVFRSGLQAINKGQYEAATALALPYWTSMYKVILPQAISVALPSFVGTCINILKMSSIFLAISLYEFLGMVQQGAADPEWLGSHGVLETGFVFAGFVYWCLCFGMSRYSRHLERTRLKVRT